MGFFDFLKRKKPEKQEKQIERIKFEELENWIKNKKRQKEEILLKTIKSRISHLINAATVSPDDF